MPELKPIVFIPVTDKNVEQLRLLNTTIFPVRYNDDFYKKVYVNPKLAQFGLFNDTPIGAVAGRIEESKETKMNTQLYIMTLGVLAPYRGLGLGESCRPGATVLAATAPTCAFAAAPLRAVATTRSSLLLPPRLCSRWRTGPFPARPFRVRLSTTLPPHCARCTVPCLVPPVLLSRLAR